MLELLCPIKKNSIDRPKALAIITDKETYTYKQLDQKLDEIVSLLKKKGIQPKQRIGFIAKPNAETIFLLFSLSRMQATACPINARLPPSSVEEQLEHMQAAYYIDIDTLDLTYLEGNTKHPFFESSPLFTLLATSGSSADPKIVAHSFENFYYSSLGSNLCLSLHSKHRWLLSLPLYHVGGMGILFRCFLVGASVVISSYPMLESLKIHEVSHLSLVPTQLFRLLRDLQNTPAPSLEAVLVGGGPLSHELFKQALKKGLKIFHTYGLTEMSSQVTMDQPESEEAILTAGIPLPFRQVKIAEDGEILVKGKTLFHGYWTREKKLELPLQNGWFATKDTGEWTPDGKLVVKGRKDHMFISGGENIHPELIEKELCELPGIVQAYVVPISDPEFGQRPIAFIQQDNANYTLEEIREKLKCKLPGYSLPVKLLPLPADACQALKVSRSLLLDTPLF